MIAVSKAFLLPSNLDFIMFEHFSIYVGWWWGLVETDFANVGYLKQKELKFLNEN